MMKNRLGGVTQFNIIVRVIKTMWSWSRQRHIDQWNRILNSEIDSQKYAQLSFEAQLMYKGNLVEEGHSQAQI